MNITDITTNMSRELEFAQQIAKLGWQQFLNNSEISLQKRLQGARFAFLSSSAQLSTHQKEDVVILWLTSLVKGKQDGMWREEAASEEESVWQLLSVVFTSKRIQVLACYGWTCPITSVFPQSIIDVLGSTNLRKETQKFTITTVYGVLSTPTIAPIITNSGSLSLNLTTALLDIVISSNWQEVADSLTKVKTTVQFTDKHSCQTWVKKIKLDTRAGDNEQRDDDVWVAGYDGDVSARKDLMHEEMVLHSLVVLLDVVKLQMLAKSNDEAMTLCAHQLLKRVAAAKIALKPYNERVKKQVAKQLESLVCSCLFNSKVFYQYELLLDQLMVEDSKLINDTMAVHIVLSMCSDIIAHEPIENIKYIISLFYIGFLEKCSNEKHRLLMLITLLYLVKISVPGGMLIDSNNLAISFVDCHKVKDYRKEAVTSCLMKVIHTSHASVKTEAMKEFLRLLLIHLMEYKIASGDGFHTYHHVLSMYPVAFADELPVFFGHLITSRKSSEEACVAYQNLLLQLLRCYAEMHHLGLLFTKLMQGIVLSKDKLKSHDNFLPLPALLKANEQHQRLLFPMRFLSELSVAVRALEPVQLCLVLDALLAMLRSSVLPLVADTTGKNDRAVSGCCWVVSCVLWSPVPHRLMKVSGYAARLTALLSAFLNDIITPALQTLLQTKHSNACCCGLLMLCRAWSNLLYPLLHSNSQFSDVWQQEQRVAEDPTTGSSSLSPCAPQQLWPQLLERLQESGDPLARLQMIELWLQKLCHLHELESRRVYQEPQTTAIATTAAPSTPKTKKNKSRHTPIKDDKVISSSSADAALKLSAALKLVSPTATDLSNKLSCFSEDWSEEMSAVLVHQLPELLAVLTDAAHHRLVAQMIVKGYVGALEEVPTISASDQRLLNRSRNDNSNDMSGYLDISINKIEMSKRKNDIGLWKQALAADGPVTSLYPEVVAFVMKELLDCVNITECVTVTESKKRKRKSMQNGLETDEKKNVKVDEQPVQNLLLSICRDLETFNADQNDISKVTFADKSSKKCGQTLTDIIAALNECDDVHFITYKDKTKVRSLLQLLKDLVLRSMSSELQVYILLYFFTFIYNIDYSCEENDEVTSLMLGVLSSCLSPAHQFKFIKFVNLPTVINRLIKEQLKLPADALGTKYMLSIFNPRIPVVVQMNTVLRLLLQKLLFYCNKFEGVQEVASFIVSNAKVAFADAGLKEEETYLRPAWILVLTCSQCLQTKELSETRHYWCKKTVSSVGSWCMRVLHKLDMRLMTPVAAAHILGIYTALIKVETNKDAASRDKAKENDLANDLTNSEENNATVTKTVNGWAEEECKATDDTLNVTVDGSGEGSKGKRWQRYLDEGVAMAKICLSSNMPVLDSTAMSFIIATKLIPQHLQQQLPADMFRFALRFFTNAPSSKEKYVTAYKQPDDEDLTNVTLVKPEEMTDPVSNKRISLSSFLADCPLEVYQSLLNDLVARSVKLEDGLFPHTASIWTIIINTEVGSQQAKAKRSSLNVLARTLVWHLSLPSSSHAAAEQTVLALGHKASVMVCMLELLSTVIRCPGLLPHLTVMQVLTAATASTRHLSLMHFNRVWQFQVSLVEHALLLRVKSWPDRVAGLLSTVEQLVQELVYRSDQKSTDALQNKELLTGCCLCLERLMRKLQPLESELSKVIQFTVGAMVTALHHTTVIAPVKNVLDQQIYSLFRLCTNECLEHLLVSLPPETRPMLQHYHSNYRKYYAFRRGKE